MFLKYLTKSAIRQYTNITDILGDGLYNVAGLFPITNFTPNGKYEVVCRVELAHGCAIPVTIPIDSFEALPAMHFEI